MTIHYLLGLRNALDEIFDGRRFGDFGLCWCSAIGPERSWSSDFSCHSGSRAAMTDFVHLIWPSRTSRLPWTISQPLLKHVGMFGKGQVLTFDALYGGYSAAQHSKSLSWLTHIPGLVVAWCTPADMKGLPWPHPRHPVIILSTSQNDQKGSTSDPDHSTWTEQTRRTDIRSYTGKNALSCGSSWRISRRRNFWDYTTNSQPLIWYHH